MIRQSFKIAFGASLGWHLGSLVFGISAGMVGAVVDHVVPDDKANTDSNVISMKAKKADKEVRE